MQVDVKWWLFIWGFSVYIKIIVDKCISYANLLLNRILCPFYAKGGGCVGGTTIFQSQDPYFLHSPPDQFGFKKDNTFQVGLETYLDQPCPLIAPLVERYFGASGAGYDKHSANFGAVSLSV